KYPVSPLKDFEPLTACGVVDSQRVVQINNALAWGGVERQVVTLMRGLQKLGYPADLLCLRLGESKDHDFFLPKFADYQGTIRNVMQLEDARKVLLALPP